MNLTTRQRAAVNAIVIIATQGALTIISVLLVPFMISRLGPSEYGILQLIRSFIAYLPLLTLSIGPAVSRYVTFSVGRDNHDDFNRYMSTGLAAMVSMSAVLLVIGGAGSLALPRFIDLGSISRETQILAFLLTATTAISLVGSIFTAPLYARERLAESNGITFLGDAARAAGIVVAFTVLTPSLSWIGVASLLGAGLSGVVAIVSAYVVAPWQKLSWRLVDRMALREVLSFSMYSSVGTLVWAIYYNTDNILIKWIFGAAGPAMITVYSVAACWDPWIRGAIIPLVRIIMPRITVLVAREQVSEVRRLTLVSIRYATALAIGPCICVAVFSKPILSLWLGRQLSAGDLTIGRHVLLTLVLPLILVIGMNPAQAVFVALVRLALPTWMSLAGAVLNLALSVILCVRVGWGIVGIAAATSISILLYSIVFVPLYLRHLIDLPVSELCRQSFVRAAALAAIHAIGCLALSYGIRPHTILELGAALVLSAIPYSLAGLFIVLRPEDRRSLHAWLRRLNPLGAARRAGD